MLCGTTIDQFIPLTSHKHLTVSSAATLAMPYGSSGAGFMSSVNGADWFPYLAIELIYTNFLTLCLMATVKTLTVASYVLRVTNTGDTTDSPSYAVHAA